MMIYLMEEVHNVIRDEAEKPVRILPYTVTSVIW